MADLDMTPQDGRDAEALEASRVQGREKLNAAIEAERAAGPLPPPPEVDPLTEEEVARWLDRLGKIVALGVRGPEGARDAYRFTGEEVDDLTPPVSRQVNKRGAWLRAILLQADLLEILFLLVEWWERARADVAAALVDQATAEVAAWREDLEPGDPGRGPATFGLGAEASQ